MSADESRARQAADLVRLIDVERLDTDLYRGDNAATGWDRIYGGQVLAQALRAAAGSVDDGRPAHSLHAYFLRPGDPAAPIFYDVDRIRDGRSFATRRIRAMQHGRAILNMAVSFQHDEPGYAHHQPMPEAPPPGEVEARRHQWAELAEQTGSGFEEHAVRERPVESRPVNYWNLNEADAPLPARQLVWLRIPELPIVDAAMQQCLLAYASDETLMDTALMPHAGSARWDNIMGLSLDHAMWFHQPLEMGKWLLYVQDSPVASRSRGLNIGLFYTEDGVLVATAVQECLMRPLRDDADGQTARSDRRT